MAQIEAASSRQLGMSLSYNISEIWRKRPSESKVMANTVQGGVSSVLQVSWIWAHKHLTLSQIATLPVSLLESLAGDLRPISH